MEKVAEESQEIVVAVGREDLRKFGHCEPLKSLEELIWNAFDADATLVKITTQYADEEKLSLSRIVVSDDGRGFESSAEEAFGAFGESTKKRQGRTTGGRIQHGREGKGRYRALGLGYRVEWDSYSLDAFGKVQHTNIRFTDESPNRFRPVEQILDEPHETGVCVVITDPTDEAASLFENDLSRQLAIRFAPRLLADSSFKIEINGDPVLTESLIDHFRTTETDATFAGVNYTAKISVCVWNQSGPENDDYNRVFLCSDSGFAVERLNGYVFKRGIVYSAFVHSSYFNPDIYTGLGAVDEESGLDPVVNAFASQARALVNQINRELVSKTAKDAIDRLKEEDAYPFDAEPASALERAEQEVFDVLAQQYLELHPSAVNKPPDTKRNLMKALKAAVTSGDQALQVIFEHVLDLTPDEQRDFKELLDQVRLSKVISFARTVTDRLAFINGLEYILFEKDIKKVLRERTQLHRILTNHLWLFGEEFNMGTDDAGLRNVLRRHRAILGLDEPAFEPDTDYSHLQDIPDLMLFKQIPVRDGEFEFLVIELKAPKDPLGEKEFSQIKKYARAVANDDQFSGTWNFVIVNNAVDEVLYDAEACQQNRPRGLLVDTANHKVWVRRWNEIIGNARGRHEWLRRQLDIQIDNDQSGLKYLAKKHAGHLPGKMLEKADQLTSPTDS